MRAATVLAGIVLVVAGCSGGAATPTSPASPGPSATHAAAASSSAAAAPSPVATLIPGCLPDCVQPNLTRPGNVPAGDYTTKYFFGGQVTVTVPEGWMSFEDSTGEFALRPVGHEDRAVLFWIDVYPIVDGTFEPIADYDGTAKAMVDWIAANPNIEVIESGTGRLGGLEAMRLEFGRGEDAVNVDPECPPEVRACVGLLSFPQWDGGFYSQGGPFHQVLLAVDAQWGGETHGVYAMIEAANDDVFAEFGPIATELIGSAQLPAGVGQE